MNEQNFGERTKFSFKKTNEEQTTRIVQRNKKNRFLNNVKYKKGRFKIVRRFSEKTNEIDGK